MPLRTPVATALVAAGGAVGTAVRWALPGKTLVVNVAGAALLGYLAGRVPVRDTRSEALRLFAGPGVLGGFTTFSTFAVELWRDASPVYGALTVGGGVAAAVLGLTFGAMAAPE